MSWFRLPRPRSINALVQIGYGLIMLPLVIALLWALFQLDRFSTRSESLIVRGTEATQNALKLQDQLNIMERVARQYQVSENAEMIGFLQSDTMSVMEIIDALRPYASNVNAQDNINRIDLSVTQLLPTLLRGPQSPELALAGIQRLADARADAEALLAAFNANIEAQLLQLQNDADETREALLWQALAVILVSLLAMAFVTWRVSKPIRVIDGAIRQLGEGQFSRAIAVRGPRDLESLGLQLEWLRNRLLELAQEKNRFLRHMSHELKTPLANIREGTELLLDGSVGELDDAQSEVTDILRSNGLKLQRLIENLLNFSAWQNRNESLAASEFPLTKLIQSVLQSHALSIRGQKIRLMTSFGADHIHADREMIKTVMDNLISNALKFSPHAGCMLVATHQLDGGIMIEIADQGPGIPMNERRKVFEAFYQGEATQGGLVAGTGIGLSVVLECVQSHDGVVEISDEQHAVRTQAGDTVIFGGAHFRIMIPQHAQPDMPQQAAAI
ncbi:MAG: HAMP domain-containing sensor histidine kinase [Pseudomonadota bacterium]